MWSKLSCWSLNKDRRRFLLGMSCGGLNRDWDDGLGSCSLISVGLSVTISTGERFRMCSEVFRLSPWAWAGFVEISSSSLFSLLDLFDDAYVPAGSSASSLRFWLTKRIPYDWSSIWNQENEINYDIHPEICTKQTFVSDLLFSVVSKILRTRLFCLENICMILEALSSAGSSKAARSKAWNCLKINWKF